MTENKPLDLEEIEKLLDMIAIVGEDFSEEGANRVLRLRKQEFMKELKQRIKSAVEGLFREIFIEVKNATQLINDGDEEARKMGYAYLDGLKFSIEKIKKWFPDIILTT